LTWTFIDDPNFHSKIFEMLSLKFSAKRFGVRAASAAAFCNFNVPLPEEVPTLAHLALPSPANPPNFQV